MCLLGDAGVGGPVPGAIRPGVGVDWALSVSCTVSFAGIWGWFLGGVLHDWRVSWAGRRGVCVIVMMQAVHRLWIFGIS